MTSMPEDRDFKKIVRRRMSKTGESYTAARARLVGAPPAAPRPPDSKSGLFPLGTFDEGAKGILVAAQAEAVKARTGLIAPEHLLLGLLRQRKGGAAPLLRALGVHAPAVRAALQSQGLRRVEHPAGRVIPAASTKRVIEQALVEAGQRGSEQVGAEHLLLGILYETGEPAARALAELGATAERVAAMVKGRSVPARAGGTRPAVPPSTVHPAPTSGVAAVLQRGRNAALKEGAMFFRSDHLLSQLVARDSQTPALLDLLRAVGTDLEELRRRLRPPRRVTRLEAEIWRRRRAEDEAIRQGNGELARKLLVEEKGLRDRLAPALDAWNEGWAAGRPATR
jgi:ATP-dependent Clp protease ATP-binding subunit ClpA